MSARLFLAFVTQRNYSVLNSSSIAITKKNRPRVVNKLNILNP